MKKGAHLGMDKKHGKCGGKLRGKAVAGGKSKAKAPCKMQRTGKYGVGMKKNTKRMGKK